MSDVFDAAMRLAELGLAVHWLSPPSRGGKRPVSPLWHRAPAYAPEELWGQYRAGYNVGIHTGNVRGVRVPVVVLDLDNWEARQWAVSQVPATPLRALTRRGQHWYYRHPGGGVRVRNRNHVEGRAVDVRGDEGQVVCPPSVHESGYIYAWELGVAPIARILEALPVWSPSWFPTPAPAAPSLRREAVQLSQPVALRRRRGIRLAQSWRIEEEGQGRGTQTYKLAVTLVHGLQLDAETAYELLVHYNSRLPQPYDETRLRRKVAEAQRAQRARQPLQPHREAR